MSVSSSNVPDGSEAGEVSMEQMLSAAVASHAASADFRNSPSVTASRSIFKLSPEDLPLNLTAGTLSGPDMLSPSPHVFADDTSGSVAAFYLLGKRLAGHAGLIHGGIAALLMDECMGRACFPLLPGKIAATVDLKVEYKSPLFVNTIILVRANTVKVEGRKAWAEATIEGVKDGQVFAKGASLFIEPRNAASIPKLL